MIRSERLAPLFAREQERFCATHARSLALAARAAPHFLFGVPMHWMRDWPTPCALHVASARGHRLECVDGHEYLDFCLGDSGAMFGHSPPAVARALAEQSARGLTAMLPGAAVAEVGDALAAMFDLPCWQLTLSATDANRFMLRWARAVTGRPKVLVFDGCYHGTVDDALVDLRDDGRTVTRASLLGQVHDLSIGSVVVPFNDIDAVEAAMARGDVACVLCEPALTNCGLVPPVLGFLDALQAACRRHGVLWVLDETHTLSTARGGYARAHGLRPDALVVGKALAGGLPVAAYGVTGELATRMEAVKRAAPDGHSGVGTTLSANLLALAALRACLVETMTEAAYAEMLARAAQLKEGLQACIDAHGLPWCVTRLGARTELQFCASAPQDAKAARAAMDAPLEQCLQLYLINRGILITPFHNMLLVAPGVAPADVQCVVEVFDEFLGVAAGLGV